MIIKVCVGSSCHLKGSYDVIEALKTIVNKYHLENDVELEASFCLGQCSRGVSVAAEDLGNANLHQGVNVSVTSDGLMLHNVNGENVESIFVKEVLPLLNR